LLNTIALSPVTSQVLNNGRGGGRRSRRGGVDADETEIELAEIGAMPMIALGRS
jgi:hypothetical protein